MITTAGRETIPVSLWRHVMVHEALHALVPVGHPEMLYGSPNLSPINEAMFRLHSHRLIRHGMTVGQIEELVVHSDELLDYDPHSPTEAWKLVWNAITAIEEAGSVSTWVQVNRPDSCPNDSDVGWNYYSLTRFKSHAPYDFTYLDTGSEASVRIDDSRSGDIELWKEQDGVWRQIAQTDPSWDPWGASWSQAALDHWLLRVHYFMQFESHRITINPESEQLVRVGSGFRPGYEQDIGAVPWDTHSFVIEPKSYSVKEFELTREEQGCGVTGIRGTDVQYGVAIDLPPAIREGSDILGRWGLEWLQTP